jgi:hypothetical protein
MAKTKLAQNGTSFNCVREIVTPERATELLEHNRLNRPIRDQHVKRIVGQILDGKWRFNGDTIKISDDGSVLDGQHRLWAIIESKTPVETMLLWGIAREAFATIDTVRAPRSGGDTLSLLGVARHRNVVSGALAWYIRYKRGVLETYRAPQNKVENADIESAFENNRNIVKAIEQAMSVRRLVNPSVLGFIYYVAANRNAALAARMLAVLQNPAGVSVDDAFFLLRSHFASGYDPRKRDPVQSIALAFKALNAAHNGLQLRHLKWQSQGQVAEAFPQLNILPDKAEAA